MIIHIVKQGESLAKIMDHYHVLKNDLMSINRHITNWDKIIPGTKIKIPLLSEEIIEELEATEPFIEDYYPKNEFLAKEEPSNEEQKPLTDESLLPINSEILENLPQKKENSKETNEEHKEESKEKPVEDSKEIIAKEEPKRRAVKKTDYYPNGYIRRI